MDSTQKLMKARAIAPHTSSHPHPLTMETGEELSIEQSDINWPGWAWCVNRDGQGGWVPETYLERFGHSDRAIARQDYTAKELTVEPDEQLILLYEESGWYWANRQSGEEGWIPAKCLKIE